ncbi:MAG: hypothetical protein WCO55_05550 [Candidatus Falkowbacteria bacterium]
MQNYFLEPEDNLETELEAAEDAVQSDLEPEEDLLADEGGQSEPALAEAEEEPAAESAVNTDFIKISSAKLELVIKNIERLEDGIKQLKTLLGAINEQEPLSLKFEASERPRHDDEQGRIVEGVFDGEKMIGSDGEIYAVPVNYASKSKLVEGDILKLTITNQGAYLFKQIGPIERNRLVGQLAEDELGNFWVLHDGRKWRILSASVTYFKGDPGDEATILVPKEGSSRWAAVENIVKKW